MSAVAAGRGAASICFCRLHRAGTGGEDPFRSKPLIGFQVPGQTALREADCARGPHSGGFIQSIYSARLTAVLRDFRRTLPNRLFFCGIFQQTKRPVSEGSRPLCYAEKIFPLQSPAGSSGSKRLPMICCRNSYLPISYTTDSTPVGVAGEIR